jgi:hypothetical protein
MAFVSPTIKAGIAALMACSILISFCCCDIKAETVKEQGCCQKKSGLLHHQDTCPDCPHKNQQARFLSNAKNFSPALVSLPLPLSYLEAEKISVLNYSSEQTARTVFSFAEGSPPEDLTLLYLVFRP